MLSALRGGDADLVVGSRYLAPAGSDASALAPARKAGSRLANWLGRQVLQAERHRPDERLLHDPPRAGRAASRPKLATTGFKVLFDIMASQKTPPRDLELPYEFRAREAGESKLDNGVVLQYLGLLLAKLEPRPDLAALHACSPWSARAAWWCTW